MSKLNDIDFFTFIEHVQSDPDLKNALLDTKEIDQNIDSLKQVNEKLSLPLLICKNPDIELPNVKTQLNFLVPPTIRKSKEPYVVSLRNDINMYRKLYEKHSKRVNELIKTTRDSITNLYQPMEKMRDDIKKYTRDFEDSIKKLSIPYENKKNVFNKIEIKEIPSNKQNDFKKDKDEVINEINEFIKELNDYYSNYEKLNKQTLLDTEFFVEQFNHLATPAKELTIFMRKFCKNFEKSAIIFNDLKDKEKIDRAMQEIKEPITEFTVKIKDLETMLGHVPKVEKLSDINENVQKIKKIINNLKTKSDKIGKLIGNMIDKYNLTKEQLGEIEDVDAPAPVNTNSINQKINEQQKVINKDVEGKIKDIKGDVTDIINQSRLDLLIILDITNSMDEYLEETKNKILDMIKEIQRQCAGSDIYLGFIGYKDFNDLDFGEEYINLEFTKDYEKIKENILYLKAEGGGDIPEDLCGALEMGDKKDWTGKSRFTVLVTDSPCHGTKYHDLAKEDDNYPDGDRDKRNIENYIISFAKKDISLYCLKINESTDKMFKIFKDIYDKNKNKDSRSKFVFQGGKQIFDIVTENAVKVFRNRKELEIKE